MIPKKIHYCWFGRNELSEKAKTCINSWKRYCPDYEIIEWNEDNFNINQNNYTKKTYENNKFAFLSDYARLLIIHNEGGVYFDVDVEVIRPLDELLSHEAFFGFENSEYINTGLGFGAEAGHPVMKLLLKEYDCLLNDGGETIGCPILNTRALKKFGLVTNGRLQEINGVVIYQEEYFNPYDDPTGILNKTEHTYSIHWFAKSWMSRWTVLRTKIMKPIHKIIYNKFGR